ncbi:helix-turn-helix domain-containing protein [Weissella oryzae]|nr:helix-turn-helix transcriptional regulator [Weissella oryzae]
MTLFERTRETAKERGYNLQTTAKKAGLSENAIYNWKTKTPSPVSVKAVASVLNVSVDYLLGETDEKNPHSNKNVEKEKIDIFEVSDDERNELISANGHSISDEDWDIIKAILSRYPRQKD